MGLHQTHAKKSTLPTNETKDFKFAIEYAQLRGFKKLWLRCNSFLHGQIFGSTHIISWTIKDRRCKCLQICSIIDFRVSHVFKKRTSCAD